MDRRWQLIDDTDAEIRPLTSAGQARFTYERDLSTGLIAFRMKLATDLTFTGEDYDYFLAIHRRRSRRCEELRIRRQWKCNGRWVTRWTGTFSTGSGTWDYGRCEFSVKPDVLDDYTCILKALNKKVNILQVEPVDAEAVIIPALDFGLCNQNFFPGCEGVTESDGTPVDEFENLHTQSVSYDCGLSSGSYNLGIYVRERLQTFCVAGSPVPPAGVGWVLLEDNCATDGTAVYVRNSTVPWTFGDATIVDSDSPIPVPPDSTCAWTLLGTVDVGVAVDGFCEGLYQHAFICLSSGSPTEFGRARPLMSVAEYMLDQSGCPYTGLVSDFFEHNPIGDAVGYSAGLNYVTGEANQVSAIVILQNSDAIDPGASEPATLGELTLKELFVFFVNAFQVYWDKDDDGNIRLEHWKHWTFPVGLDLDDFTTEQKSEPLIADPLNADIPRFERMKFQSALGADFVGVDIEYSGPCVTNEEASDVKEYNVGPFISDISFVIADPDAISKQGFTVLATTFTGSVYQTILDFGALTGNMSTNTPLSVANLERDYWTWNRFLADGTMNRLTTEFDGTMPNVEQKGVDVELCCETIDFDPKKRVDTALGKRLGGLTAIPAHVQKAELDEHNGWITLTLRYPY